MQDLGPVLGTLASIVVVLQGISAFVPWLRDRMNLKPRARSAISLIAGVLAVASIVLWSFFPHTEKKTDWNHFKFETVTGKTFRNQKVIMDGKAFYDCTFDHVEFEYNGTAPSQMYGAKFDGIGFVSQSREVNGAFVIMKGLGLLNPNIDLSGIPDAELPGNKPRSP